MDIQNCKECGKLFAFVRRNICPECIEREEQMYHKVRDFLNKYPGSKISEIAEKLEIPEEKIIIFLKDGRISSSSLSDDMGLRCESCGAPIPSGRICGACKLVLSKEVEEISGKNKKIDLTNSKTNTTANSKNKMFTADHYKK